jgi:hypothetical protein
MYTSKPYKLASNKLLENTTKQAGTKNKKTTSPKTITLPKPKTDTQPQKENQKPYLRAKILDDGKPKPKYAFTNNIKS